jgi:ABC-type sugar transport system substrate-binding protein
MSSLRASARPRSWARCTIVGAAAAVAVLLAGCSSSSNSAGNSAAGTATAAAGGSTSSSAPTTTAACMSAANAYLAPYQTIATALPSSYTPLPTPPPKSGSIVHIFGTLPTEIPLEVAQKAAAEAIGWKYTTLNFDGTVADLNVKFDQAVAMKPTMITLSGYPVAAIAKPLAAAKKAGIVVVLADVPDNPTGYPGFSAVVEGGAVYDTVGTLNAYEFMHDSNCQGHVAIFSLAYPILKAGANTFTKTVQAHCPACKVTYNELQAQDLGTPAATSAIITKLQSDTSTKYVYAVIGDVALGLTSALGQAGLRGITVFGADPDASSIAELRNGTNKWWVQYGGAQLNGWAEIDAGLRSLETRKPVPDSAAYPIGVFTKSTLPSGNGLPVVPANYEQDYRALWHVNG